MGVEDDFDVDLFSEEDEVFGLASAVLGGRPLLQAQIFLDPTIDDRLSVALRQHPGNTTLLEFERYRALVRDVALAVARTTGMPIVERSHEIKDL